MAVKTAVKSPSPAPSTSRRALCSGGGFISCDHRLPAPETQTRRPSEKGRRAGLYGVALRSRDGAQCQVVGIDITIIKIASNLDNVAPCRHRAVGEVIREDSTVGVVHEEVHDTGGVAIQKPGEQHIFTKGDGVVIKGGCHQGTTHNIRNGRGAPGRGQLYINGELVGNNEFPTTVPILFGIEGLSCGYDFGEAVTHNYQAPFAFTGLIKHVTVDISGELIEDDDAKVRMLMAQQ